MQGKEMFWLTGHTQAGTTLLQKLFDGHPDCATYPVETYFYRLFPKEQFATADELKNTFLFRSGNALHLTPEFAGPDDPSCNPSGETLLRAFETAAKCQKIGSLQASGFRDEAFFRCYYARLHDEISAVAGIDPKQYVEAAFTAFRAAVAASRPGFVLGPHNTFKHPCGRVRPDTFDWFFDNWPDGKAVFLTRNPFARVWSYIEQKKTQSTFVRRSDDRQAFHGIAKAFTRDYVAAEMLGSSKKILKVHYEDLVTRPETTLRRICTFLGIDFSEVLLQPSGLGFADHVSTNRTGSRKINANSLQKWKTNLSNTEKTIIRSQLLRARARKIYRPERYRINIG